MSANDQVGPSDDLSPGAVTGVGQNHRLSVR